MTRGTVDLVAGDWRAVFLTGDGFPELAHLGRDTGGAAGADLFDRTVPPGGLDSPSPPTLVADPAAGWHGEPGLLLTSDGSPVVPLMFPVNVDHSGNSAVFSFGDTANGFGLAIRATLDGSGVLSLSASVTNNGSGPLGVAALKITVPVPAHLDRLVTLGGRHAMEFCEERTEWDRSVVTVSSRRGRTSHQQSPTVFCAAATTGETSGDAWGIHLAWSGNFALVCDAVTADARTVTAGEILAPGEVVLAPGDSHSSPELLVSAADDGLSGVSSAFHGHIRSLAPEPRRPRPVIVNTWEAVYFDHDTDRLFELARRAAAVGAERFVLDDGWFMGRRNDNAGLGDWNVDPVVWPDGLAPLAELVRSLGMDFGIWVEPEMVNPDSALYRAHPEWVLGAPHQHALTGRNQLVLDMSRPDVQDHLVAGLHDLLSSVPVAHVKWDHNRDLVAHGAHGQALGLETVLDRLRTAHPGVDFESCASGGGRIDARMASRTARFWTSDSIDALDRLAIQRGAARVIPPEMLGAHIGAPVCHTTGRRHPLPFRALSALPFWLGIEWDLLSATDRELARLAEVVAVHKEHRDLFHSGTTVFCMHPQLHVHAVVSQERGRALVVVASTGSGPRHIPGPVRVHGLDPTAEYRCSLVPLGDTRFALNRGLPRWLTEGTTATGAHLANVGLPAPPLLPASGVLVRLERAE